MLSSEKIASQKPAFTKGLCETGFPDRASFAWSDVYHEQEIAFTGLMPRQEGDRYELVET